MSKAADARMPLPPYIPFKTFSGFIDKLKDTIVPDYIDRSLLRSYSGSIGRHLIAALKFLQLIEENGRVTDRLQSLVKAAGTDSWKEELSEVIFNAYRPIIGDYDLDRGTSGQLDSKFKAWGADGQVLRKCVVFFLNGLTAAGTTFSPHLITRPGPVRNGGSTRTTRTRKPKDTGGLDGVQADAQPIAQAGIVKFSVPVPGKQSATIFLPADLAGDDWDMIDVMMRAYVARMKKGKQ